MADNTTKSALILSIIAILTAAGIPIGEQMLAGNEDILDNYYVCEFFEDSNTGHLQIYEFDRLSGSKERGYPTAGTTKGYTDCTDGSNRSSWQSLVAYAESLGIDPYKLLGKEKEPENAPQSVTGDKCWKCDNIKCVPC